MTTNNRLSRFDNDKLGQIENSGSINNQYLRENGVIRTKVGSTDPLKSLAAFPVRYDKFSQNKISEIFDTEFSEFVEDSQTGSFLDPATEEELGYLRTRLAQLTAAADNPDDVMALSVAQKDLIIEMRILMGEGKIPEDFVQQFPYLSWGEYIASGSADPVINTSGTGITQQRMV